MSMDFLNLDGLGLEPLPEGQQDNVSDVEDVSNLNSNSEDLVEGIEKLPEVDSEEGDDTISDEVDIETGSDSEDDEVILESNEDDLDPDDVNVYSVFAEELMKSGLIPEDVDISNFKNAEDLVEAAKNNYKTALQSQLEEFKSNLSNEYKNFLDSNAEGDINQTSDFLKYEEKDFEDNDDLNIKIMTHYYKEIKGLDDKVVSRIIDAEVNLEDTGKEMFQELKKLEERKKADLDSKFKEAQDRKVQEEQQYLKDLADNTKKLNDFVPGVKLTDAKVKKLVDSIPEVLTTINSNKENYLPKLALMMEMGFFDGKFDTLLNTGATKNTNTLDNILKSQSKSGRGGNQYKNSAPPQGIKFKSNYSWDK